MANTTHGANGSVGVHSKAWSQWISFNSNNLAWVVLTVVGVLFTSLLLKAG